MSGARGALIGEAQLPPFAPPFAWHPWRLWQIWQNAARRAVSACETAHSRLYGLPRGFGDMAIPAKEANRERSDLGPPLGVLPAWLAGLRRPRAAVRQWLRQLLGRGF